MLHPATVRYEERPQYGVPHKVRVLTESHDSTSNGGRNAGRGRGHTNYPSWSATAMIPRASGSTPNRLVCDRRGREAGRSTGDGRTVRERGGGGGAKHQTPKPRARRRRAARTARKQEPTRVVTWTKVRRALRRDDARAHTRETRVTTATRVTTGGCAVSGRSDAQERALHPAPTRRL